jgi:type 1 glutamine amidotransferase
MRTIRTLILTGQNNHDWARSTPFIAKLLEDTGRFSVTIEEDPVSTLEDAGALANYQLIFSDYNGPDWSEQACSNFENAIRTGTGLVIFHAADNCFDGWVEYEKMCGVKYISDAGSGHGDFTEINVTIENPDHPITAGIADFDHVDELYFGTSNPHGVPVDVLATAFSVVDEKGNGTGKDEPVLVTVNYGDGRVFRNLLGHIWPGEVYDGYRGSTFRAFETPAFQTTLIRGCEWAATGSVSS